MQDMEITLPYCSQIKKRAHIKARDSDTYRKFQNFLIKYENIDQIQGWNVLNTPDVICMLVSNLPRRVGEIGGPERSWQ